MKQCTCCKAVSKVGEIQYEVNGRTLKATKYYCPIDKYSYVATDGMQCAEICQVIIEQRGTV